MVSPSQIRDVISHYVRGGDANEFVLEFSKLSFDIVQRGSPAAVELAGKVECKLAEMYVGHLTQAAFRLWLRDEILGPTPV